MFRQIIANKGTHGRRKLKRAIHPQGVHLR
jgi:hypothetical protein